jgi:hypothetical protein
MIIPSGAVRVLVAMRPVDFRKGMDGLAAEGLDWTRVRAVRVQAPQATL